MKNNIKFLGVILFIYSFTMFSQTGEVVYKIESLKEDHKESSNVQGVEKEYELMSFTLRYNKEESNFVVNKIIPIDNHYFSISKILSGNQNTWFQNRKTKESLYNKRVKRTEYQVVNIGAMKDWVLLEETQKIKGYICYKAVREELVKTRKGDRNVKYIVWYTPEIPAPYGPIGNGGLPGLILRLEKLNRVAYTATEIILNKKNIKIKKPKEGEKVTSNEIAKLMRLARKVTED